MVCLWLSAIWREVGYLLCFLPVLQGGSFPSNLPDSRIPLAADRRCPNEVIAACVRVTPNRGLPLEHIGLPPQL